VSGVAGLIRSFAPDLAPAAVEDALATGALRVGDFVSTGRVDAGAAIGSLTAARSVGFSAGAGEPPAGDDDGE